MRITPNPNIMPEWGNGRPSRLKICRPKGRTSSTLVSGTGGVGLCMHLKRMETEMGPHVPMAGDTPLQGECGEFDSLRVH